MRTGQRIVNASLVVAVVAILAVFACYVRIGATADKVVVLKTSGMTCSSCVAKVSKALQSERGVAATEVDLMKGWVMAGYDSKQVAPEKLARTVSGCGFNSRIEAVITPEQFRRITGHGVGKEGSTGGCCGAPGCCGKEQL